METIYAVINGDDTDGEKIRQAGEILKAGGLVAFPTETVYGLGGDALNPDSSRKIYAAKGRPSDNPLIVHICRWEDIYRIAEPVTEEAERLAEAFWPGPLTMILQKKDTVPKETTGGLDTVAIRFVAKTVDGKVVESSYERGDTTRTAVGDLMPGLRQSVRLVGEGGRMNVWIPSRLAYGAEGDKKLGVVPNATLFYEIELVDVR